MRGRDSSSEESRTVAIGARCLINRAGYGTSLRDHVKHRHRDPPDIGQHRLQDCGQTASSPSVLGQSLSLPDQGQNLDQVTDVSESSSDHQIPQSLAPTAAMDWNGSGRGSVRTSLRGAGDLGQNRLSTGFHARPDRTRNDGMSSRDVVEISDDSEVMDDSEGGILLNVDAPDASDSSAYAGTPIEISDDEDGHTKTDVAARSNPVAPKSAENGSDSTSAMFRIDVRRSARTLADLNAAELERQIKYALFHLRRDQIDLSRPVTCLACLNEGHSEDCCPGLLCTTCEGQTRHANRLCPKRIRCSKCGGRGHGNDQCRMKAGNSGPESCDFCGGGDHVEASCTRRFFPARGERPGEVQLWMSCARCGSKEHMAGDCPASGSRYASAWSLRGCGLRRENIVNLSLQRGVTAREKDAEGRGLRPEGIQLTGWGASSRGNHSRGGAPSQSWGSKPDLDEEDFTSRIGSNKANRARQAKNPRPLVNNGRHHHDHSYRDDSYRPRRPDRPAPDGSNSNSYRPPPSHDYRDRYSYGGGAGSSHHQSGPNQRHRSRSRSPRRPALDTGDSWRPPPATSLPARPVQAQQPQQQQQHSDSGSKPSKKARRKAAKGKNGSGEVAVQPMRSAGQKAWNKARL